MKKLKTRWSAAAAAGETLSEYPRPQMARDSFYSLNGFWRYAVAKLPRRGQDEKPQRVSAGNILVPFCPESELSGVGHILKPDEVLLYQKKFTLPEGFAKDRVLLHFGGVDQQCKVWVNGHFAGAHEGGYTAFSLDITEYLTEGENELRLRVRDETEFAPYGRGKQRLYPKGKYASLFYTPVSGIWKTVWLESVPKDYIRGLHLIPLYDEGAVEIELETGEQEAAGSAGCSAPASEASGACAADRAAQKLSAAHIEISFHGEAVAEQELQPGEQKVRIPLGAFHSWTPEHPDLYDLKIRFGADEVRSYFGMRKISAERDKKGILRFFLNNEPIFMNGLLDQGYWPDGLLTAPSDEALIYDIQKMKDLGYNLIRKHVKTEPDRFYYHCDRLGMLVWQDMPNGGGIYNMFFVTELPNTFDWFCRSVKDSHYAMFARSSAKGRKQYYEELEAMIRQLGNHPSIVAWVPFNEGWGQFDAKKATALIRRLDPERLVNEACGWFDQGGGDMYSIHNYRRPLTTAPQKDRVVALTEYGGYSLAVRGHFACEKEFGYKAFQTSGALTDAYEALIERDVLSNIPRGLSAAIYTQTSDIEEEINGLMTYDREVVKFEPERIRAINRKIEECFSEITVQNKEDMC